MAELMPLLARNRYSDEEWELSSSGRCDEVVESGMYMGRIVHCGKPSDPGSFYRLCTEHDEVAQDDPTYGR